MDLRRTALFLFLLMTAMGGTCDTLVPKDFTKYASPAGLMVGEGDPDEGRAAFVALRCHSCHTVHLITFEAIPTPLAERIPLGGEVAELPTDAYLATAIINPSHSLAEGYPREVVSESGRSRMADYGDYITLHQLRDLVAFLHTRYRLPKPATP